MPFPRRVPPRLLSALFWCAAAALLAWGAWQRFRLPLPPFADLDAWHFVNPALSALEGGPFYRTEGGAFLYPAFLLGLLRLVPDLRAVTVVQHALGLGCAVLLLTAWWRIRALCPHMLLPRWMHGAAGLGIFAVALLARNRVGFEHQLRPEAVTGFFAALNFLLTLEFIRLRFFAKRPPHDLIAGGLLLVNSFLLFLLKPSHVVTMLLASAPVFVALFDRRETWLRRALLTLPAACVIVLLGWAERRLPPENKAVEQFLPATLFVIHANLIADQMQADLAGAETLPYDREWLGRMHARLREEIEKSRFGVRRPWVTLGFNPDYLMYEESFCALINRELPRRRDRPRFYSHCYRRAWAGRPLAMAQKIAREMREFYSLGSAYRDFQQPHPLGAMYRSSAEAFRFHPEPVTRSPAGRRYVADCAALASNAGLLGQPAILRIAVSGLAQAYLPILLLCLAVVSLTLFSITLRARYGVLALLALLFFGYNFGNCIATAIVHSLSVQRYIRAQFVFTLFSQAVGLLFLIELAFFAVAARRDSEGGKARGLT